ncbi:MAG: hypothetical protein LBN08_07150 [Lactobacillales bacterium]|jgi:hypothetical protein|nr:hypothetical protein [Lactobacillales bacterium]
MKKNKLIAVTMLIGLGLSFSAIPQASAGTLSEASYNGSFTSEWHKSAGTHAKGVDYGFNTFLINEDLAYAYYDGGDHHAVIINGGGTHNGPTVAKGKVSNYEIQHQGSSVIYRSAN